MSISRHQVPYCLLGILIGIVAFFVAPLSFLLTPKTGGGKGAGGGH